MSAFAESSRAGRPADPSGVYEQLIRRHERRVVVRRLERGALAIVVIVGTILVYGLSRVFVPSGQTPGVEPSPVPITADNGLIAYVRDWELHTMEPDGAADRVIAGPSGQVRFPGLASRSGLPTDRDSPSLRSGATSAFTASGS
jgi:hypothetical protein